MSLTAKSNQVFLPMVREHDLGDYCIHFFSFGEVYRRIHGGKFSFTATRERSRKT